MICRLAENEFFDGEQDVDRDSPSLEVWRLAKFISDVEWHFFLNHTDGQKESKKHYASYLCSLKVRVTKRKVVPKRTMWNSFSYFTILICDEKPLPKIYITSGLGTKLWKVMWSHNIPWGTPLQILHFSSKARWNILSLCFPVLDSKKKHFINAFIYSYVQCVIKTSDATISLSIFFLKFTAFLNSFQWR